MYPCLANSEITWSLMAVPAVRHGSAYAAAPAFTGVILAFGSCMSSIEGAFSSGGGVGVSSLAAWLRLLLPLLWRCCQRRCIRMVRPWDVPTYCGASENFHAMGDRRL